jgi:photosystem II stability/assembly factor-like uncharacterized protein
MIKNTSLKLFAVAFVALFSVHIAYAQSWVDAGFVSNPGATPSISVVNADVAWICGGAGTTSKIFKTTNGGLNWIVIQTANIGHELGCIAAPSADIAFVGEGIVNGYANLYKTANGGDLWTSIFQTPVNRGFFNGLVFTKANNYLFALAIAERIYRSSNSGVSWVELNAGLNGVSNAHNSLFIVDNDFYGFGMNNGAARVRITPDNSNNWVTHSVNISGNYTSAIAFHTNKLLGVAATSSSLPNIARTTDGGTTWYPVNIGAGLTGTTNMQWIENTPILYILGSNGKVKRSNDNGLTWNETPMNGITNVTHFDFIKLNNNVITGYAVSSNGNVVKLLDSIYIIITGKNNNSSNKPVEYKLSQNYPNPFNPNTIINIQVPEASNVKLAVYNCMGQEVSVLKDEFMQAGEYDVNFNAAELSSGVYYYKLTSGTYSNTKKMILIR